MSTLSHIVKGDVHDPSKSSLTRRLRFSSDAKLRRRFMVTDEPVKADLRVGLILEALDKLAEDGRAHRAASQFPRPDDWIFSSPQRLGRLASYTGVRTAFAAAGIKAGIGKVCMHAFRHTYRSWLDAVGTSVAVQQKLRRHSGHPNDAQHYDNVGTDDMSEAGQKVTKLALPAEKSARRSAL